jgi:hypothetical protein
MFAAHGNGRRTETVRREHTRDRRTFVDGNHEYVLAIRFADIRFGPAKRDAGDRMKLSGFDRREIDSHGGDLSKAENAGARSHH